MFRHSADQCRRREAKTAEEKRDRNHLSDGYVSQPVSRSRFPSVSHDLLAWYFHQHGSMTVSLWPLPPHPPTHNAVMQGWAKEETTRGKEGCEERSAARVTSDFPAAIHFFYLHNIPCSAIKMNFGGRLFLNHCLQGYFDWSVHTRVEEMLHNWRHRLKIERALWNRFCVRAAHKATASSLTFERRNSRKFLAFHFFSTAFCSVFGSGRYSSVLFCFFETVLMKY